MLIKHKKEKYADKLIKISENYNSFLKYKYQDRIQEDKIQPNNQAALHTEAHTGL